MGRVIKIRVTSPSRREQELKSMAKAVDKKVNNIEVVRKKIFSNKSLKN